MDIKVNIPLKSLNIILPGDAKTIPLFVLLFATYISYKQ